ncbi:immunoglobulin superfamily member 1-like [Vombatus ursinus]|uniref:immunoglobulin superfamily member 1-like n=1 Tax=Vombatus ursinus TaxID=29139 RepID=UPI000FFD4E21|nr:immunoglobulin superfamily member 1-like [Vombatus ursinus]
MGPTVTFLFSIGLCLDWALRAQMDTLPRPTLWAIPSPVVPRGADVTLRCQGHLGSDRFQLWKDGELREERNASWQQAEFVLRNVDDWRDARSYSCRSGQGPWWSELSEALALVVTGALPKPSISVSPRSVISPGTTVTIWCQISPQAPSQDYSFALLDTMSLEPFQRQSPAGTQANFSFLSVRPEDTGSYSCIYYKKTAPHRGSHPSETLELIVPGLLPKPTLWAKHGLVVTPGANITLWCSSPKLSSLGELTFTLWKAGTLWPLQQQASADLWTSFLLLSVRPEDTGSYSCTYRGRTMFTIGSKTSDALELVVPDVLPKPSISALPGPEVASGANVTLLCWGPSWTTRIVLYKKGHENILQSMDTTQDGAKFFLTHVTPKDSGNYTCGYQLLTNGSLWTQHSDPLQLRVTGEREKSTGPTGGWSISVTHEDFSFSITPGSESSNTFIITFSCVSFLQCLLLLAMLCRGSVPIGEKELYTLVSLAIEMGKDWDLYSQSLPVWILSYCPVFSLSPCLRCLCGPCLSWSTCLPHHPEAPREEILYTEMAKKRTRDPLFPMAEDPQGITYAQLNIRTLNERKTDHTKTPTEPTIYSSVPRD